MSDILTIRLSAKDKRLLAHVAAQQGYPNPSELVRAQIKALSPKFDGSVDKRGRHPKSCQCDAHASQRFRNLRQRGEQSEPISLAERIEQASKKSAKYFPK